MQTPIDLTTVLDEENDDADRQVSERATRTSDTAYDVLYENQRGWWFCGIPFYSSASLLNFDPPAWVNAQGKPSPVNVTNAQTPDPSWQWVWPTWYVDMSHDVDEEGWQYSSWMFRQNAVWHGAHPWPWNCVRRRRWIRMRRRGGKRHAHEPPSEGRQNAAHTHDAHLLNADYFTIHPTKTLERASTYAPSMARTVSLTRLNTRMAEIENELPEEIENIQTLLRLLKTARVDRERIGMVLQFLEQGGQDIYYLSEQMPNILKMFMFQYTRRQLLSQMLERINEAREHRLEHQRNNEEELEQEKEKIDNLLRAVQAAEQEVKTLEYWSDIRDIAQEGDMLTATEKHDGWGDGWQGLDQSGANPQQPKTDEHGHIQEKEARTAGSPI